MMQAIIPAINIRTVAAIVRYDPHAICGAKRRTSINKASKEHRSVRMPSMNIPKRYLGECDAECMCEVAARMSIMRQKKAATGCRTRIAERVVRVEAGRSKLAVCFASNSDAVKDY
jgi:hypothetical protein